MTEDTIHLLIEDYNIVGSYSTSKLIENVKELLGQGWAIHGPIVVIDNDYMHQAMVKYPDIIRKGYKDMLDELRDMETEE